LKSKFHGKPFNGLIIGERLEAPFQSLSKILLFHYTPCLNSFHGAPECHERIVER
jgi:hypothetical protein